MVTNGVRVHPHTAIYRYPLNPPARRAGRAETVVRMPRDAVIIHGGKNARGEWSVWALVDADAADNVDRTFVWIGTGINMDVDGPVAHVASVGDAQFVWHLFEVM